MGGLMILIALITSTLLWAKLNNSLIITVLLVTFSLGLLGFFDDYLKIVKKKPEGLIARNKLIGQSIIALLVAIYFYYNPVNKEFGTSLPIPFFNKPPLDLNWLYIPFVVLVIVGASNAVNLTDGLDGLAIGAVVFAAIAYAGLSYVGGNIKFANYLRIIYVEGGGELTVFLAALIGAGLGFLWFNAHPAEIFMGDVGSLALGGALGTVAVLTKNELLLLIVGGLFVMEASSVLIQVASYKLRKNRVFLMAPLHHHFERKGWKESKIIIRFWIIAIIFMLLSLSTLKLR
jgi:phospho-N-acetylmuramoyl-pentapeptide-transferase